MAAISLNESFARAKQQKRAALIAYLCASDPDFDTSLTMLRTAADAGVDILEVGIPFSDPTADGVAVQRAAERALKAGATVAVALELVRRFRADYPTPVVLFGYYNPIFAFGEERFAREAKAAGAQGVLVVDLPLEVSTHLRALLQLHQLGFVPLVAPNTSQERARRIAETASGFVYLVSVTGVTGAVLNSSANIEERARALRASTQQPLAVGFGIRSALDVARFAHFADGVVVGSALVQCVEEQPSAPAPLLQRKINELRSGLFLRAG